MTDIEIGVLCDRANLNEDEANDALRAVQLLCAKPPHGIQLDRESVRSIMWAAASLHSVIRNGVHRNGGEFYAFVEEITNVIRRLSGEQDIRPAT
jgi:hypothetical protein